MLKLDLNFAKFVKEDNASPMKTSNTKIKSALRMNNKRTYKDHPVVSFRDDYVSQGIVQ